MTISFIVVCIYNTSQCETSHEYTTQGARSQELPRKVVGPSHRSARDGTFQLAADSPPYATSNIVFRIIINIYSTIQSYINLVMHAGGFSWMLLSSMHSIFCNSIKISLICIIYIMKTYAHSLFHEEQRQTLATYECRWVWHVPLQTSSESMSNTGLNCK